MRITYVLILVIWVLAVFTICLSVSRWNTAQGFERQQTDEFEYNLRKLEDPDYDYYHERRRQLERQRDINERLDEQDDKIQQLQQQDRENDRANGRSRKN